MERVMRLKIKFENRSFLGAALEADTALMHRSTSISVNSFKPCRVPVFVIPDILAPELVRILRREKS